MYFLKIASLGHWKGGKPCLDFIDVSKERVTQSSKEEIQAWRAIEEGLLKATEEELLEAVDSNMKTKRKRDGNGEDEQQHDDDSDSSEWESKRKGSTQQQQRMVNPITTINEFKSTLHYIALWLARSS